MVDNTAPAAPTGLTATPASTTQINLAWTASTDATSGIAGYDVYRGGTKINTSLITTTSYSDTGLTPATLYSYYVKATDKAGNVSAASNTATATTPKAADLNGDGTVNIYDLSTLLTRWGTSNAAADLNGNGTVDILDIGVLIPLLVI
jgi:chitodextrinase